MRPDKMNSPIHQTNKYQILLIAKLFFFGILFFANGDEITLKSGGSIAGIITEAKNGSVTIDVGFGNTVVDTADIASISRSNATDHAMMRKLWHDRYAGENPSLSPAMKPFVENLRRLRALRIRAINRQRDLEQLDCTIDSLEHALTDNAAGYQALNPALTTLSQKNFDEQYRLVGKAHQFNASIIGLQQEIENKKNDQQNGNPALSEYMDSLAQTDEAFCAFKKSFGAKSSSDDLLALNGLEKDLQQCGAEFKTAVADATFIQGNHIVVPVTINGRGPVKLLLDTGASTVTLSRALAARLGINWRDGIKVTATLADGQKTNGYSVLLRSVTVGDFTAAGVRAVVLDKPPCPGIDGLLGMSFLQRFILRIDPANKKFVMKKIIAR
jgi:clan AA aspartic protease (TIGR02281 family)